MSRAWKKWSRSKRANEIKTINEEKVKTGLIIPNKEGTGFTNRSLKDALEAQIKEGLTTKAKVVKQLKDRLKAKPGEKESKRLSAVIDFINSMAEAKA